MNEKSLLGERGLESTLKSCLLLSRTKPKEGIKMATVKVGLEDTIMVKRSIHGSDFLVTQFVSRTGCFTVENQVLGLKVSKSQSLQVLKETSQWGVLGWVD